MEWADEQVQAIRLLVSEKRYHSSIQPSMDLDATDKLAKELVLRSLGGAR